jgi:hypothetical protein
MGSTTQTAQRLATIHTMPASVPRSLLLASLGPTIVPPPEPCAFGRTFGFGLSWPGGHDPDSWGALSFRAHTVGRSL